MAKGPYNETVMDHFMNPRNVGEIERADAVGEALGGLPEAKIHCSVMAEEAVRLALEDYRKKKSI